MLTHRPTSVTGAYSGWDSPVLTTSARDAFVKLGASSDTTDELLKYAYSVNLYYQTAPSMELTSAIEVIHRMQRPNSNIRTYRSRVNRALWFRSWLMLPFLQ